MLSHPHLRNAGVGWWRAACCYGQGFGLPVRLGASTGGWGCFMRCCTPLLLVRGLGSKVFSARSRLGGLGSGRLDVGLVHGGFERQVWS